MSWKKLLLILALIFLIPGGIVIVGIWAVKVELDLDKKLSAYYDYSFGKYKEEHAKRIATS